jgi:hypothetical protein
MKLLLATMQNPQSIVVGQKLEKSLMVYSASSMMTMKPSANGTLGWMPTPFEMPWSTWSEFVHTMIG